MSAKESLPAIAGWRWVTGGFAVLRRAPAAWLLVTALLVTLALASTLLPAMGAVLLYVASPGLLAGALLGCKSLVASGVMEPQCLVAGFRSHLRPLLRLGLVYTTAQILLLLLATAGGGVLPGLTPPGVAPPPPDADALPWMLAALLLSVPLTLLMWFAPALVVLRDMAVWPAMRYSMAACLFHWKACLVNGIVMSVLLLLATLPMMLGLLLWVPLMVCSLYAAYAEVFGDPVTADLRR
ncbi:MAG: hypothetical protein EBQ53_07340 [Betaproteobacteria bacterium]|nr:hypothetical protein [Betaproteobacteria bacterium]NBY53404.1 hypothetical protein [Betaproteobacteria bacterium]NCU95651.1 hypothetical protein [Betaproteobacteria bacterium]NDF71043.1 hypothetical protein [Betaproteobacteria bacterium]